jgi:hypothetical protein
VNFNLCVFYTKILFSDADAITRYQHFCSTKDLTPYIKPHFSIDAFLKDLTAVFQQLHDYSENSDEFEDCPWSCSFDVSKEHIIMPVGSADDDVIDLIVELSKKHGLVLFCSQGSSVHFAPKGLYINSSK